MNVKELSLQGFIAFRAAFSNRRELIVVVRAKKDTEKHINVGYISLPGTGTFALV